MNFVGFYDYTVIVTYISLISAIFGMIQAVQGNFLMAVNCLILSGICDAFDGSIARTKKNRTKDEKMFGIQIDSLCDLISFGVFPAILCFCLGLNGMIGIVIIILYCLCAVIRLAFYNVLEAKRQEMEEGGNKIYHGLPVTSASIILPITYLCKSFLAESVFIVLLHLVLGLTAFLFVLDIPIKKPQLFKK